MQIFDDEKRRIGTLTGFKERKIVSTLDSGDKELTFKYPANGKMVKYLKEEYYIRTKTDEYVLKAKKTGDEYNEYTAQLNVEELESQVFEFGFESKEQTIRSCLEFAFEGTGWTVGVCDIKKKRTINIDDETNAWNVLQDALSTYRCECKIDSLAKRIDIYEAVGQDRGRYFIEKLNLRKLTVSSDTYDFYTRIIPIGKDNITIEWQGKPYIENHQYSKKNKTYVWKDERYTNTTSLIEDGTAKLEEMSKPYVSYEADIIDLAKQNKKYANVLDFEIGDAVWIISKRTHTREKQRIVKLTEYPEEPQKNTAELSNISKTFAQVQQEATEKAKTEAINSATSSTKKTLEDNYYTKEETESHITASADEINLGVSKKYETKEVVEEKIQKSNELTDEKLTKYSTTEEMKSAIDMKADEINLEVSKTYETTKSVEEKIQKSNELTDEKLSNYSTTEEMKAAIDLKADDINLEVSKKYETKESVTEKITTANKYADDAAKSAADEAEKNADASTTEKLKEYSTTEEMKAAIDLKADDINLSVSKTYETKESVTEKITSANKYADDAAKSAADEAEKNADASTTEKLKEYSTTEEMKAAIDLKADDINLSVSKTYETKESVTEKITTANKYADDAAKSAADEAEKNANDYSDNANESLRDDTDGIISEMKQEFSSEIDQTAESIKSTVYESVYKKDEVEEKLSTMSTEIEQTKDSWQVTFNKLQQDVSDVADGNDAKYEEIQKYIRFEGGNIIIGNSESPLILKIQNDRLQFLQDGYEVAYITDKKMYNTSCQIVNELSFGDSAWKIETNEDGDEVVSLVGI